jgi:RimJ/RimL family protein N-acetyltransferase
VAWPAAQEALRQVVATARECGVLRLYALSHAENPASLRVLEKCCFACEGTLRRYAEFPNLRPGEPLDVLCYSIVLG